MAAQTKAMELGQLSDQLVLCIMGQNIGHTGNINNSGSHRNNSTDEKGDDENLEMKNTAQLTDVWGPSVSIIPSYLYLLFSAILFLLSTS
jgi:hypothetical protein